MAEFEGKTVLVTGAGKGIGRAIALAFGEAGASVIVHYGKDRSGAEDVLEELRVGGSQTHQIVSADLSRVSEIRTMFVEIRKTRKRLDTLVNNAGITAWTDVLEITEEGWDQVLDTNLKGTFFCSQEAAKMMRGQESGSIVNVSTNCAALGVPNLLAYAVSKQALHGLTRQLAVELARYRIRVNTFAPGPTNVARNLGRDPEYRSTWGAVVPLGRTAEPEEMTGTALFLASDRASFVTGQLLYVDGGWSVAGRVPDAP